MDPEQVREVGKTIEQEALEPSFWKENNLWHIYNELQSILPSLE